MSVTWLKQSGTSSVGFSVEPSLTWGMTIGYMALVPFSHNLKKSQHVKQHCSFHPVNRQWHIVK
jgi:hypothetical protein